MCYTTSGGTPKRSEAAYYGGDIPWVKSGDLTDGAVSTVSEFITQAGLGKSSAKLFSEGTLLIAMYGATVGKLGVLQIPAATNQAVCGITPSSDLDRDFLFFVLLSRRQELIGKSIGGAQPNISQTILRDLTFPLPPIEEQRRIVDILNRAASIERLKARASAHLRDFIPALFLKMFGDRDEIANRYPTVMLKELADIGSGVTKGRKLNDHELVDVPYLRVANVQDGYLDLNEIKTIPIRESERDKYGLQVGDLVLTEGGDPDKLGRGALWQGELPYCAHQNHVFRVRPDTAQVIGPYLKEVVGSAYGKAYFLSVAKQTTGIASINKTQLGQFPVPVPPMELQADFTKLVEAAQARARLAEKADSLAADLARSLLDKLLGMDRTTRAKCEDDAPNALAV